MNTIHGITAAEFKAAGNPADHYLPTFSGFAKAGHIRQDWWIVCPDENAGFGLSFCCGPETRVYPLDELQETFGDLPAADGAIVGAGGHMAKALAEVAAEGLAIANAEYMAGVASTAANMRRLEESGRWDLEDAAIGSEEDDDQDDDDGAWDFDESIDDDRRCGALDD